MTEDRRGALERWIATQEPDATSVQIEHLAPIDSVGNAREPWSFVVRIERPTGTERVDCVMLIKASAGQLETMLAPEFLSIRAVHGTAVPVARPLWMDADGSAFGLPFFVTERMPGVADMRLLRAPPGDPSARRVLEHLADVAADLHALDPTMLATDHLAPVAARDAALAQLDHWEPIAEEQRLEPLPALRYAFRWLRANAPGTTRVAIVHGDLRVGNFLADGDTVTALLDWEMVHLGDPHEDLAWTYRVLWTPERALAYPEFLARYTADRGMVVDADRLRYYQMLNEVKHAVISLTVARSFHDRRSSNLRFADRNSTLAPFLGRFFDLLGAGASHEVTA